MNTWKRIDKSHNIYYLNDEDVCIFAREFHANQGYNAGETNQLIFNFKKSPDRRDRPEWTYRDRDVRRFATEVSEFIPLDKHLAVTAVPSSKAKNDPMYDNRFEDMFTQLIANRPNISVVWPVEVRETTTAAHDGGTRNPQTIMSNYIWRGFPNGEPSLLLIFDDVLSTGSHYRAAFDFIRENGYTGRIMGVFWARSVWPVTSEFDVVSDEEDSF